LTYAKYKPYVTDAGYLLPPSLADFLGTEDEVHIIDNKKQEGHQSPSTATPIHINPGAGSVWS
jgi:hypothetical protein